MNGKEKTRCFGIVVWATLCSLTLLVTSAHTDDTEEIVKDIVSGARNNAAAAAELLKAAKNLSDAPKTQIAVYEKAYEYGLKSPAGYGSALEALDMLDKLAPDRANTWKEKRLALYRQRYSRAGKKNKRDHGQALVALLVNYGDKNFDARQWKKAIKFYGEASSLAGSLRLGNRNEIRDKIQSTKSLQRMHDRAERLKADLAKTPGNARIRTELIRLYLVSLNAPQEAVKYLNDDCDETLCANVPLAVKPVDKLEEADCLKLGSWYPTLAKSAKKKGNKERMLKRAREYLERYLDLHKKKDTARLKASADLQQVETELNKLSDSPPLKGAVLVLTFEKDTFFTRKGQRYIRDLSGKRNHGKVFGGKLVPGKAGSAMAFDGKTYLDFGNPTSLQITGDLTIFMWVNPAKLHKRQGLIDKAYGGEYTWTFEESGKVFHLHGEAGRNGNPYEASLMTRPLKTGIWGHLAIVRDVNSGKITWYNNGIAVRFDKINLNYRASKNNLLIGKAYTGPFFGMLDEVAVFNRPLSTMEIKKIYKMGLKEIPLRK
jgi:hypothetical protein